jgi:hypothetical protein
MKKVVAFLLIFVLILSAAACESGGTKPGDSTQPKSSAQESGEGKSITRRARDE